MAALFFCLVTESSCSLFTNRDASSDEKDISFTQVVSPVNTPHVTTAEVASEFYENQDAAKELGIAGVTRLAASPVAEDDVDVLQAKKKKNAAQGAEEQTSDDPQKLVAKFEPSEGNKNPSQEDKKEKVTSDESEKVVSQGAIGKGVKRKYKVKNHDTLMKISYNQYGTIFRWRDIFKANRSIIKDYRVIHPGQVLTLYGKQYVAVKHDGEIYLILKNDNLGKISQKVYGDRSRWKEIWKHNRDLIKNPNKIYAGFNIYYQKDSPPAAKEIELRKPAKEN